MCSHLSAINWNTCEFYFFPREIKFLAEHCGWTLLKIVPYWTHWEIYGRLAKNARSACFMFLIFSEALCLCPCLKVRVRNNAIEIKHRRQKDGTFSANHNPISISLFFRTIRLFSLTKGDFRGMLSCFPFINELFISNLMDFKTINSHQSTRS